MRNYEFIHENPRKIWTLIISTVILALLLIGGLLFSTLFYDILNSIPYVGGGIGFLVANIKNFTPIGMFFASLLGGIFFVPSPDELIFYYSLLKGNSYFVAIILTITGYMIAQVANYYAGNKISWLIMQLVSKKKVYDTRRFINKYGALGIFIFNFMPFPAPLLTFSLGIARYNFTRLFVLTFAGKMAKFFVLILIHALFA